ncbi:hypothetical protein D3Z53_15615 [Lachnospiraceae bacterium]|jgi:hypothetical protein|nr:hypothetical protein [Lachnospiraceae bacterium]
MQQICTDFPSITNPFLCILTVKYPAASYGIFDPRGIRQISMQAWLLGSLLRGNKKQPPRLMTAAL